jgi:hypothetical protein
VHPHHAELSSIASALDELVRRIAALAEEERTLDPEGGSTALAEVERNLGTATRRLEQLLR